MGWRKYTSLPLAMSVLGVVVAASLLVVVLGSTAATGPAKSPRAGSGDTASNGSGMAPAESASSEPESESRVYEPVVPPERPPDPVLSLNDGTSRASATRQLGVPVYHHWVVDGKTDVRETEPPISWPDPLDAMSTDEPILDLGTKVMPGTVEVYVYEKVGPDGVPEGDPTTVLMCESGRLVPGRLGGDSGPCVKPHGGGPEDHDSRLALPINSWKGGHYFLAVSASWPVRIDEEAKGSARTPTYDGAWIFSLEVSR